MPGIFDRSQPTLDLRPGPLFRLGMTFQDVRREGVTFKPEIDMKTVWFTEWSGLTRSMAIPFTLRLVSMTMFCKELVSPLCMKKEA